jgi:enterochelin esterase-like enzyme
MLQKHRASDRLHHSRQPHSTAMRWLWGLGFVGLLLANPAAPSVAEDKPQPKKYDLGPDSQRQDGVPEGTVERRTFASSKVFEGTTREYFVYSPANVDAGKPLPVMVFQDGHAYVDPKGQFRTTVVLDNLIARGELPAMRGVFVNPGHKGSNSPESPWRADNRSVEYDTLSGDYATFLLNELLPEVHRTHALTDNPDERAICGISSGGICAWTVAWERPDAFRKVLSHIGSFTNIRGGHVYPALIRKTERKPIRVFLQDGSNDLDNPHGNWWLANLEMEAALKFSGYDFKFVGGEGAHDGNHGGAILPESLKWLWRTEPSSP